MLLSKILPQTSRNFTQIYLPYLRHYQTLLRDFMTEYTTEYSTDDLVLAIVLHFLYEGQRKPLHIFSVFPHFCSMWDLYGNSRALLRFIE